MALLESSQVISKSFIFCLSVSIVYKFGKKDSMCSTNQFESNKLVRYVNLRSDNSSTLKFSFSACYFP